MSRNEDADALYPEIVHLHPLMQSTPRIDHLLPTLFANSKIPASYKESTALADLADALATTKADTRMKLLLDVELMLCIQDRLCVEMVRAGVVEGVLRAVEWNDVGMSVVGMRIICLICCVPECPGMIAKRKGCRTLLRRLFDVFRQHVPREGISLAFVTG